MGARGVRLHPRHQDEVRVKIQTSQIINRLQNHLNGEVELSATQVRAAEVLLKKSIPDLAAVELSGDEKKPVSIELSWLHGRKLAREG